MTAEEMLPLPIQATISGAWVGNRGKEICGDDGFVDELKKEDEKGWQCNRWMTIDIVLDEATSAVG